jgi:hypothetical protein
MKRLFDIGMLVAVTAIFGVSLTLLGRTIGLASPWFALIVLFSFLGWIAFARPLFILRLPSGWREVRAWEVRGRFYRALGVPGFGELLRRTPLRLLQPLVYLKRYPGDPAKVQIQMEGAEAAHLWAAIVMIPYMGFAGAHHWWGVLFWFGVVQVVGNIYPIMHLRWVRGRLTHLRDRKRRHQVARKE